MFIAVLALAQKEDDLNESTDDLQLVIRFPPLVADGIKRYSADQKNEFYKAFVIDCVRQIVSNRDGKLRRRNGVKDLD